MIIHMDDCIILKSMKSAIRMDGFLSSMVETTLRL